MKLKFYCFTMLVLFFLPAMIYAQGCVAVRNMSSCAMMHDSVDQSSLQISLNYRYFRSYKHFRGDHEEKERVHNGTEVINNDNSVILGLSYAVNNRLSFSVAIPYLFIDRSSLYEHYGNNPPTNPRFHTQSRGIGDIRMQGYYNVRSNHYTKFTVGLGLKLPTGKRDYKDHFHKQAKDGSDSVIYKVVDQSMQLGDGGLGLITEASFTKQLGIRLALYADGMYMLNPRNTNGVLRSTLSTTLPHGNEFSVADQFLARAGVRYALSQFQFGLGGRVEGIPARDLIGRNDGFRRPGHIVSVEPSVTFARGAHLINVNVPVALYRNRIRSVYDVQRSAESNRREHGDAAFADWLLSVTYAYRISR